MLFLFLNLLSGVKHFRVRSFTIETPWVAPFFRAGGRKGVTALPICLAPRYRNTVPIVFLSGWRVNSRQWERAMIYLPLCRWLGDTRARYMFLKERTIRPARGYGDIVTRYTDETFFRFGVTVKPFVIRSGLSSSPALIRLPRDLLALLYRNACGMSSLFFQPLGSGGRILARDVIPAPFADSVAVRNAIR